MPSKSAKQRRFMAAAANNPDFARRAGIKQSVAKEFHRADYPKKRKYQTGGLAMANPMSMQKPMGGQGMRAMPPTAPWMRRPPPQGGLASATKPLPGRMPDPRMMSTTQPVGPMQSTTGGPGRPLQRPPMASRSMPIPQPGTGPLSRYAATQGFPGAARRPQVAGGARNRIMGRVPGAQPGNGLLRTADAASQRYGNMLNRLQGRFAGGGRVSKRVAELKSKIDDLYKRRATTVGHNRRGRMNEQIEKLERELAQIESKEKKAGGGSVRKKSNA